MTVAIITDSPSDIPAETIKELGINVIPLYVQFGKESYRDSVDLMSEEFYHKMMHDADYPKTSTPSLGDFIKTFDRVAQGTKDMLGIHLGAKISGTYNVALSAAQQADKSYNIELLDTQTTMMGAGLLTIEAAKLARTGIGLGELTATIRTMIPKAHTLSLLDNAMYLGRGGHTSKNFKEHFSSATEGVPLVEIREQIKPFGKKENRASAIEAMFEYVHSFSQPAGLAVEYAVNRAEAEGMAAKLKGQFPGIPVYISIIGAVVGAHFGPGALAVSILEK